MGVHEDKWVQIPKENRKGPIAPLSMGRSMSSENFRGCGPNLNQTKPNQTDLVIGLG